MQRDSLSVLLYCWIIIIDALTFKQDFDGEVGRRETNF